MKGSVVIFLLFMPFFVSSQIITTFAGTGPATFGGDGGPATSAQISDPGGGTFDKYGNYYFVGLTNERRIRKVDTNGIITTVAGGGTGGDGVAATAASLNAPEAIKLDAIGNLFISDGGNNNIRRVDHLTGIISTIAGTGASGYGGDGGAASAAMFNNPQDICFDKKGNLYICDPLNYRVRKINTFGIITTFAGTGSLGSSGDGMPATAALLDGPEGIVADDTGNIYIADAGGLANKVRKVDTFGIITTVAGNGSYTYSGDGVPAIYAQINPFKIAIDSFNNLFIADRYNERAYKVDVSGILHCVAGNGTAGGTGDGGPATAAELYTPNGVYVDACGNLYIPVAGTTSIPDSFNNIRKVNFNPTCDPHRAGPLEINELKNSSASVYPNPAKIDLTLLSDINIVHVIISTVVGQTVCDEACGKQKVELNIGTLTPGLYLVAIIDEEGNKTIKKIIKQ